MSLLVYVVYHVKLNFFLFCTNSFIFQSQSLWLGLIGWLGLHGFLGLLGLTVFLSRLLIKIKHVETLVY